VLARANAFLEPLTAEIVKGTCPKKPFLKTWKDWVEATVPGDQSQLS